MSTVATRAASAERVLRTQASTKLKLWRGTARTAACVKRWSQVNLSCCFAAPVCGLRRFVGDEFVDDAGVCAPCEEPYWPLSKKRKLP